MAAPPTEWQKSLRRSDVPAIVKPSRPGQLRNKRLASVSEDVFDENVGKARKVSHGNGQRRRLSTRGSVSEVDQASEIISRPSQRSPSKKPKALSFLRTLPPCKLTLEQEEQRPIPSPIPLPPGVTNIDPDDDATIPYSRDIIRYAQVQNDKNKVDFKKMADLNGSKIHDRRDHLVEWMVAVAHCFDCSQQTLYHTIDLMDRVLERSPVPKENLQLLGITSFFLATKLDEYYPADLEKLCAVSEDSIAPKAIRAMELQILALLNWETYHPDPMLYVNRYLIAAGQRQNTITYELTIMTLDAMAVNTALWEKSMPIKASICVLSALLVTDEKQLSVEELWSPNLKYYTGIDDLMKEHSETVELMLRTIGKILKDTDREFSLTAKYTSQSRHSGLLKKLTYNQVTRALGKVSKFIK